MKVFIASDHAGLELKNDLHGYLKEKQVDVTDFGTTNGDSVHYPDFARKVAEKVGGGSGDLGVLVCGTGIGMAIMANKFRGVRAAVCATEFEARMARMHNDANVLCLGQRVVGVGVARSILDAFLNARFEGGRHAIRVQLIDEQDQKR